VKEQDAMRDAMRKVAPAPRPCLPLGIEGLLERMGRRGVVEVVVPLPLERLLACGTPAGLARELAGLVAGDPALLRLVEWEPVDVEGGAVLLLVRAIAPEDVLRALLTATEDETQDHDTPAGDA